MKAQVNLELGPLRIDNLTQRTIGLLGGKGTGKTTLMKMINYRLSCTSPQLSLYVFDPLNVMNIEGFQRITVPKNSMDKGAQLAQVLNKTSPAGNHLIIALRDMVQEEQATFMNSLFANWHAHDAVISIDEMHDFCPEGGQHGTYCTEVERAFRHWRNRNDGFIFASQRPSKINKNVLELADALNINRMSGSNDRDAVERYLKGNMDKTQAAAVLGDLQHQGFLESYLLDFRARAERHPAVKLKQQLLDANRRMVNETTRIVNRETGLNMPAMNPYTVMEDKGMI